MKASSTIKLRERKKAGDDGGRVLCECVLESVCNAGMNANAGCRELWRPLTVNGMNMMRWFVHDTSLAGSANGFWTGEANQRNWRCDVPMFVTNM
jgi:hypothetical protein